MSKAATGRTNGLCCLWVSGRFYSFAFFYLLFNSVFRLGRMGLLWKELPENIRKFLAAYSGPVSERVVEGRQLMNFRCGLTTNEGEED
jgi:hypothetical protein